MAKAILVAAVVVAALVHLAAAAVDHTVTSWDASGTNYNAWASVKKFSTGDNLVFSYTPSHNVMEVSKADYDACSASSSTPLTSTGGKTTVKLATAGKHYFICGVPGHCAAGMKLVVNVVAASTATPAKPPTKPGGPRSVAPVAAPVPAPAPAPESSSTDELPNVSSPTGAPGTPSGAASIGAKAAVALAMGMALALAM